MLFLYNNPKSSAKLVQKEQNADAFFSHCCTLLLYAC